MIASTSGGHPLQGHRAMRPLAVGTVLLVLAGFVWANSGEQLLAYLIVLTVAVLPSALWIRMGTLGIPVFPMVALVYIPYFARPALNDSDILLGYSEWEIVVAAIAIALFLLAATVSWRLVLGRPQLQHRAPQDGVDPSREVRFALLGLLVGIIFHIGTISGSFAWVGSFFGLVRIVAVTFVTVALFLIGVTRGQGHLRGNPWAMAVIGTTLLIILTWSSLFLVGGVVYILAMLFGYVIAARRVPWLVVGTALIAVTVLHAGKAEMREKYWETGTNYGGISSVMQLPGMATEWVANGIKAIATNSVGQSAIERTSLLQMVLRVQRETPDHIDYLNGETYALLPSILVPRFIESDKPASQVGMDLLNRRYGLISVDEESSTAIGWGLIAEAYANYGYFGVIGIALLVGGFCGKLEHWGKDAAIISLPTLTGIAATMVLINIELDFIQACSTLLQSFASVLIFLTTFRLFVVHRGERTGSANW